MLILVPNIVVDYVYYLKYASITSTLEITLRLYSRVKALFIILLFDLSIGTDQLNFAGL